MRALSKWAILFSAVVVLLQLIQPSTASAQKTYATQQKEWRAEQEKDLTKSNGWLTLAGLYWLKEGRNFLGGAKENDLVLPGEGAPPFVGVIEFHAGVAWFTAQPGVPVVADAADSATVHSIRLAGDDTPLPTVLRLGTLSWNMIKRGDRYGIRVRDSANPRLTTFTGMKWYPAQLGFRITARFTAYAEPRTVPITNVVGDVYQMKAPGLLTFTIGRQEYTLEPVLEDEKLFIIFRDQTSGKTTYGAGRFLYADAPKEGKVILDFNQAVNPPCAFTPFATCPLPPAHNWLKVAIPAGELKYHDEKTETAER
jgi:uncharacterized protein (DUF1684 family)